MAPLESHQQQTTKKRIDRTGRSKAASSSPQSGSWPGRIAWTLAAILLFLGIAVGMTSHWWRPMLGLANAGDASTAALAPDAGESDASTSAATGGKPAMALSPQGRKNIGLTLTSVVIKDFSRTVSMPATIVGCPGRSEMAVSAPMTGIVTRIHSTQGEAVLPGAPMFDLRLTHEDLVEKQSSLLRSLEELDVVKREVVRLDKVTASGAVAGKRLLEQQYEQQKIEAVIRAEQQALLLHGLTEEQTAQIVDSRRLLNQLTINAPPLSDNAENDGHVEYLQVAEISVRMGEHVGTGTQLATVTDHCELLVEGKAFEQDADSLTKAANSEADVTALIHIRGTKTLDVPGLRILYVENQVQRDSRALKFYVRLPNELVRNEQSADGHRFIGWRYRPGQRVELLVPVERWEKRIVLPTEAVIQEGPESYVYIECGGHFDRKPVHVEYRDQRHAVIESDGSLFPGDKVVATGAYQVHLSQKNEAGGGVDPHAGHNH